MKQKNSHNIITKLSLIQLVYLLGVILFGAYVRASGSGAGCGSHWPLCNGEALPTAPSIKTIIEFTHRLTSSLTLPLSALICFLIYRGGQKFQICRKYALLTVIFVILEGLLGAGLVLFEHVADNKSAYRALSMSLHLINTFSLMAFATLTWISSWYDRQNFRIKKSNLAEVSFYKKTGMLTILFIGTSGAITALGDTLFPVSPLSDGLSLSFNSSAHLFVKLRIYHPFIAIMGSAFILFIIHRFAKLLPSVKNQSLLISALIISQVFLGFLNIYLMAPNWMQLVHLFFAELIWMAFITICYSVQSKSQA